jgi:Tol biopolymer transport system component
MHENRGLAGRFLAKESGVEVTVPHFAPEQFWLLDLDSKQTRQIASVDVRQGRTFDITPDGKQIVFDRLRNNSDVVLIELPARR